MTGFWCFSVLVFWLERYSTFPLPGALKLLQPNSPRNKKTNEPNNPIYGR
jgi:hypothetical protein